MKTAPMEGQMTFEDLADFVPGCPHCGRDNTVSLGPDEQDAERWACSFCGHEFVVVDV